MRCVSLVLALALVLGAQVADAQASDDAAAEAQKHWTAGMAHFQLEEWDDSIREWEAGFRLKPVPQFLYNIAQAYRQSKRYEKALSFYRKYLRMEPEAPNRVEVEGHIKTLDRLVAEQQKASNKPPVQPLPSSSVPEQPATATAPPPPRTTTPPLPPTETPPSAATTSPAPAAAATSVAPAHADLTATAPRKQSVVKKAWFWGVVAGAVVVVAAAVTVGVVVGSADSTKTLPMVRF